MIVVTGGAGFVGCNLVRGLNAQGATDILVVDDLAQGRKFRNLTGCRIDDYMDKERFRLAIERSDPVIDQIDFVFHKGACTDTTEWDGRRMMQDNYEYSKLVLGMCLGRSIPLIYASSAAVYGSCGACREETSCEAPLNLYAWSKWLFDLRVRRLVEGKRCAVVGLRYFNVYGPCEYHKGNMASMVLTLRGQAVHTGMMRLFGSGEGCAAGEHRRDFVHIDDVVAANLWFWKHPDHAGIFNVGSGQARTFNDLARAIQRHHAHSTIEYIPFPDALCGVYQTDTKADLTELRATGCDVAFRSLESGVADYLAWLDRHDGAGLGVGP